MSYENRIRENRDKMSKSFSRLADYILDNYVQAALMTATELAHQVDVDAATVVRFAQRLEYAGFPELQDEIKDRVKQSLLITPKKAAAPDTFASVVDARMQQMKDAIEQARMLIEVESLEKLVEQIGKARRIIVVSDGLGQVAAYNLLNLLEQGGFLVSVAQSGVGDLARTVSTANREDLILAIDVAGAAPYLPRALAEASEIGVSTAAIVGSASHDSATKADIAIAAQTQEVLGLAVILVDVIVYTLAESLRWKYKDRFSGVDKIIEEIFERIQMGSG
ncbi:MAG: MurR/RpiR family transcriptional regulator [Chloroflexota bacterium]